MFDLTLSIKRCFCESTFWDKVNYNIYNSYGSIGVEALLFLDVIESEATLLGMQDPLRISKASFLSSLPHQWQSDNAAISDHVAARN